MDVLRELVQLIITPTSVWSVAARAGVWFLISLVILWSTANPDPDQAFGNLKKNLALLLVFLVLSSGLMYLLFGFYSA